LSLEPDSANAPHSNGLRLSQHDASGWRGSRSPPPGLCAYPPESSHTHSPTLHAGQSRGLDQTLAKTEAKLTELATRLQRGKTRRTRDAVTAEITTLRKDT
jgi:hypothetical protein